SLGQLAVRRAACGNLVRNDTLLDGALRRRHVPRVGRGLQEHHARGGTALTQVLMRASDALASTRSESAPDLVAGHAAARCGIFPGDLAPVALELFDDELSETGAGALAHLGAGDADDHGIVGAYHHPRRDLR